MTRRLSIWIPLITLLFLGSACPQTTSQPMGAEGVDSEQLSQEDLGGAPGGSGGSGVDDVAMGDAAVGGTEAGNPYTLVIGKIPTDQTNSCLATKVVGKNSNTNETIECPVTPPNCDFSCHVRSGPGWGFDLYNGDNFVAVIKIGESKEDAESSYDIHPGEDGVIDLGMLDIEGGSAYPENMEEVYKEMTAGTAEEQGAEEETQEGPAEEDPLGLELETQVHPLQQPADGHGIFYKPGPSLEKGVIDKMKPPAPLNPDQLEAPEKDLFKQIN